MTRKFGARSIERWAQQPQGLVEIDQANPYARGLLAAIDPGVSLRLNGRLPTTVGAVRAVGKSGPALDYAATKTTYAADAAFAAACATSAGLTLCVLVDIDTLTNYGGLLSLQSATTTGVIFEWRIGLSATDAQIQAGRSGPSGALWSGVATGGPSLSAGQRNVSMMLVFPDNLVGSFPILYINGAVSSSYGISWSGSSGTTPVSTTSSNGLVIGGRGPDTTTQLDGRVSAVRIWGRGFSAADAIAFTADPTNPFRMYAPRVRRVRVSEQTSSLYVFNPMSGRGGAAARPLRY
jgi:hypothetical protein